MSRNSLSKRHEREIGHRKRRSATWFILIVVAVYLLVVLLSRLIGWQPQEIVIEGVNASDVETVEEYIFELHNERFLFLIEKDNKLFYPRKKIHNELLQEFPKIKTATIRARRRGIHYVFEERSPQYVACAEKRCWYVDRSGKIYSESPIFSPGIYDQYDLVEVIEDIPRQLLSEHFTVDMERLHFGLQELGIEPAGAHFDQKNVEVEIWALFGVSVDADSYIIFSTEEVSSTVGVDDILHRLDVAYQKTPLAEELEVNARNFQYLDMRFADKMYYKFDE